MDRGLCLWCGEPVLKGESAEPVTYFCDTGAESRWLHHECRTRSVLGSVGHQRRLCSCFGGAEEDPPGMTRRQAARAAMDEAQRRLAGGP